MTISDMHKGCNEEIYLLREEVDALRVENKQLRAENERLRQALGDVHAMMTEHVARLWQLCVVLEGKSDET